MKHPEDITRMTAALREADIYTSTERYHRGEMSPVETQLFLDLLEQEPKLKEQARLHQLALRASALSNRQGLRDKLDQAAARAENSASEGRTRFRPYFSWAAAVAMLVLAGAVFTSPGPPSVEYFGECTEFGTLQYPDQSRARPVGHLYYHRDSEHFFFTETRFPRIHWLSYTADSSWAAPLDLSRSQREEYMLNMSFDGAVRCAVQDLMANASLDADPAEPTLLADVESGTEKWLGQMRKYAATGQLMSETDSEAGYVFLSGFRDAEYESRGSAESWRRPDHRSKLSAFF